MTALYRDGLPIAQIATRFGISRQRAQQLLDRAGVWPLRGDDRPRSGST